ncbi:MAG TPA: MarR family transcriptional regulator [Methylophilus sp.]|nr:MarR family transcriptional regulator [Methylophilus sp.]HQQ32671.1 MarR family transcriptional regulator [Methylophilus sp.]
MLQLKDLPDSKILKKFAKRYPEADVSSVIQFLHILRIGSDLSDALDKFLGKYGLLQGRWWVMILLMREDDLILTSTALAEKAGVSKPTMTGLIDGLVRDGLVARLEDNSDRRRYSIKLTSLGQKKLDEIMPDYYLRVRNLMGVLPSERREELLLQLMQLKENSSVFD